MLVRRELVAALTAPYPDEATATAAIATCLTSFYQSQGQSQGQSQAPANPALVTAAIGSGQRLRLVRQDCDLCHKEQE